MALRVESRTGEIVLTWPLGNKRFGGASEKSALRFIDENKLWIERQRKNVARPEPFLTGGSVSILGADYTIEHRAGRGLTRIEGTRVIVHGAAEHLPRRLRDFLRKTAEEALSARTREKCLSLGLKASPVRVIDPKTRWGSCAPDGRIMFSWRLVMAPERVLDYVVAHEVAHRVHMNHSRKFWALCLALCEDGAASRRWLKLHGARLMALG